jgi:hypothetical protein
MSKKVSQFASAFLYPDSDGKPMAENTLQYAWIVRLVSNLKWLLKDRVAFVAGDLLWYPVPVETPRVSARINKRGSIRNKPSTDGSALEIGA